MNQNDGLKLIMPRIIPALDTQFRPAVLANRNFQEQVRASGKAVPVQLALEQADGSVCHFQTEIFSADHPQATGNFRYIERLIKFLLWSRGGFRLYFNGPGEFFERYFYESIPRMFDAEMMGLKIYGRPFETIVNSKIPPQRANTKPLGRHLDGCRIGFDLGGSDRKVAAVIDGKAVFSEEVVWNPVPQTDPQYHFDGIMDSLRSAAKHLPRVDAIGGSAAGVYVNNRVKVASLFRGVPPNVFNERCKDLFLEIKRAWNNVPFEIINDGEVTALAGSMSLNANSVLGIALGTSTAGGYVTPEGNVTSWLNELAFTPIDYNPNAPVDEWSGDYGCGVQYFSQQCVGRLMPVVKIECDPAMPLPEKLKLVQSLMEKGDERARKIYETIGTYLGYGVAHFADFYDLRHVLILGRVTSGPGGDLILAGAKEVLRVEFPDLFSRIAFHTPDEKDKRHGQAVAAASLPRIEK